MEQHQLNSGNIVFFDGVCGLCNSSVDFLIRIDKKRKLFFAPLQGETAKNTISNEALIKLDSIIFYNNGQVYEKSTAIIKILQTIGGFWQLSVILYIFPPFIRDFVYTYVAKNRYKWFGKKESCRMPKPEEKKYLLP